jgi:hypothetical protein
MLVVVRLLFAGIVLVIVRTVFGTMLVLMGLRIGIVGVLVGMRMLVPMAVLMRVLMGMCDAIVGMFMGVSMLVRVLVFMRMFVLPVHSSPHYGDPPQQLAGPSIGQRALAVRGAQHAIDGVGGTLRRFVEVPHL